MIYAMPEVAHKEDVWMDSSFWAELDKRTKDFESGKAKLITIDKLEQNARKAYKKVDNDNLILQFE